MTVRSLATSQRTTCVREDFATKDVRTLIAEQLGVKDDLGADWLDRLELMIVIEDRFGDVEITDDDADRIDVVGDLIRHIESVSSERRQRRAA
jgi:acyl carrier protein